MVDQQIFMSVLINISELKSTGLYIKYPTITLLWLHKSRIINFKLSSSILQYLVSLNTIHSITQCLILRSQDTQPLTLLLRRQYKISPHGACLWLLREGINNLCRADLLFLLVTAW